MAKRISDKAQEIHQRFLWYKRAGYASGTRSTDEILKGSPWTTKDGKMPSKRLDQAVEAVVGPMTGTQSISGKKKKRKRDLGVE